MRIKELVIDGYKSYATRTTITDWDSSFNAITGLNGSGKSNILDAICFVLGLTNLTSVRANHLKDLIYKSGQAGVTKASVSIIFDNTDKKGSPIGYENDNDIIITRNIVLGGQSRYTVNGYRMDLSKVHSLLHSVQLNINNPNFLVQQGKITKVLSMKPKEILALLEEAAGTHMYDERREKALRTLKKKETKVQELRDLLRDEIDPKLEKLRQEKRAFLEFQQTNSDLERLTRLVVAHEYIREGKKLKQSADDLEAKKQRKQDLEESAEQMKGEIEKIQEDIKITKATRDKELRKGGKFQALEEEVKAHSHDLVRLTTNLDLKKSSISEEVDHKHKQEQIVQELESQLQQKVEAYRELEEKYKAAREELAKQEVEVSQKEQLLQELQTGVASNEGQEGGYQGKLQDARNRESTAATEQEQAKLKIKHLEKQIKEDEPKAKKAKQENAGLLQELEAHKLSAKKLEADLASMGVAPGKEAEYYQQESHHQARIRELRQQADDLRRKVANVDFSYSDPSPRFDRSRVKGLVAQLFTLDKDQARAGTALEICAGGRLYNVVVDTAETSKQLIQNGRLRKRYTVIPMNKIKAFKASAEQLGAAHRAAPGKAHLALSLIGYEEEVAVAMEFVFGRTFICEDATTAKAITFNENGPRMKSVTLEGDVYDPQGTLSGGSAPQSSGVLVTLQKLSDINNELASEEEQLAAIQSKIARSKKVLDAAKETKKALDLKTHEIELTEQQIKGNSSSSIIQAVEEKKESIVELQEQIEAAKTRQAEASRDVKRIEKDMREFNNNKGSKLAAEKSLLEKLKKAYNENKASLKPLEKDTREAKVEAEQCTNDLAAEREQLEEAQVALRNSQEEIDGLVKEQAKIKSAHDLAQANLATEQEKLTNFDDELREQEEAIREKNASIAEAGLETQSLVHEIERFHKERDAASGIISGLEKEYSWIVEESDLFGRPGTAYDFKSQNMPECKARRKALDERLRGMKNKVNPKVMATIDSTEKKEASLKKNMSTVQKDKKKIEETIEKLDVYKKEKLQEVWKSVDSHFGNIFNELLPGSFAKLDLLPLKTILDGLEIKVMLGKVWKESLTELSGGQRSLAALALMMALLQYKPAPMYILDEVDAALDLSHTQNIGRLIKTRFKGAQFIVVSLKEGMFDNANQLYRTRFVNGTSEVHAKVSSKSRR